ncbi:hypothetical protein [Roseibium polysiphoniae]|uniref:hypothetical protein n=1 Tax=Roseibium polysiphoniae TaxID=2571221 RepID=UPI001BCBB90E|nr:hypothetical protein [Roseibium polysiphoniae]
MFKKTLILLLPLAFYAGPAFAAQTGNWKTDKVQGFEKYWTETADGSRFTIWCNRSRSVSGTVVDIDIDGRNAPARKKIRVVIDRSMLKMDADAKGYVQTNCAACADGYTVLWNRLRSGVSLAVKFDDERYAAFSLKGAREILSDSVCPADFYK